MSIAIVFPARFAEVELTFLAGGTVTTSSAGDVVCKLLDSQSNALDSQTYAISAAGTAWPWEVTLTSPDEYLKAEITAEFFATGSGTPADSTSVKPIKITDPA